MKVELHLDLGRVVIAELVPSGVTYFSQYEILQAQKFQEMALKIILDRAEFVTDFVTLQGSVICKSDSSTFYLFLPVLLSEQKATASVDWGIIERCLASPIFRASGDLCLELPPGDNCLVLANGPTHINDITDSLVYFQPEDDFFFVYGILHGKDGYCIGDDETWSFNIKLTYPEQPLLKAKRLFRLRNLLHNRNIGKSASLPKKEHFYELPPELCELKILGLSKDAGSSLSLLPSIGHRLESLLVAVELKHRLSSSFVEGSKVTAYHILEALTTENCKERLSLEKLGILGTAFLKYVVGRYLFILHDDADEGQLTRMRSDIIKNSNLYKLAIRKNIQVYIRDQQLTPSKFFAVGRQCHVEGDAYSESDGRLIYKSVTRGALCSKCYHMLHKRTIAYVVEALVGAFIVDGGFEAAIAFLRWMDIHVDIHASQVNNVVAASRKFLSLVERVDLDALENLLDYTFHHKGFLIEALIHPSYGKHVGGSYERMEFLGDAVLDYLVTSYFYSAYPSLKPGILSELRAICVNNNTFAGVSVSRSFHKFLLCDSTEICSTICKYANFIMLPNSEKVLSECLKCPKVVGDLVETIIAAILLDTRFNLATAWKIMISWLDHIMKFSSLQLDPGRELLEFCHYHKLDLEFLPFDQGDIFFVEARVSSDTISLSSYASSHDKNSSKKIAAHRMIEKLKACNYKPRENFLEEALKMSRKMEPVLIGYNESPIDVESTGVTTEVSIVENREFLQETSEFSSIVDSFTSSKIPSLQEQLVQWKENVRESLPPNENDIFRPQNVKLPKHPRNDGRPLSPMSCKLDDGPSKPMDEPHLHATENNVDKVGLQVKDDSHNMTARSRLNQCCINNGWKLDYECCKVAGPSHLKEFTFKTVVEMKGSCPLILESFGAPKLRKKASAEHAATGALWYLQHEGHLQ